MENQIKEMTLFEQSVSKCSTALLNNLPDAPNIALEHILTTSKACRIYIFENYYDDENDLLMKQTYEICAEGIEPQLNVELLSAVSYERHGYQRWRDILSSNNKIKGDVVDFPYDERVILEPQGIKSILVLPIFSGNKWFGFIGFDYTKTIKVWAEWDLSLLVVSAELFGAYFNNIKNLKQINSTNQELKALIEEKDRFLHILAHDLRTPLASTAMLSNLLINKLHNYSDISRIEKILATIRTAAQSSYDLLDELLLWGKANSGALLFKPETILVSKLCNDIISSFSFISQSKNISVIYKADSDVSVIADKNLLKTILRNLISNALKFTNDFGKVIVHVVKKHEIAEISVIDNGIGIPEKHLKTITDSIQVKSKAGTLGEEGAGIGLKLCYNLVKMHNGKLRIFSKENEGTTFTFTLPLSEQ